MSTHLPHSESEKILVPRLPGHVAVIMDGNGRWARRRGKPRTEGHRAGAVAAREIVEHAARLGLKQLTLYSFSVENWSRPAAEVNTLMRLYIDYLISERPVMLKNNIRFRQIGRREGLPPAVLEELDRTIAALDQNTGMTLCLAVNYGSRAEITDAVRAIARKVQAGILPADAINEETIAQHLYTAAMPDPDLLIRTAGEMRVSNYLLWQISYAELFVTDVYWPDFTA
ncbi:MAG: polyprenyl diphosphate synthase, partial [Phycisphaerae bacterium]